MSSNLYDNLPQSIKKMLEGTDLEEAAKQIDAEIAEQQAKVYADKLKAKEATEQIRNEFTKARQKKSKEFVGCVACKYQDACCSHNFGLGCEEGEELDED